MAGRDQNSHAWLLSVSRNISLCDGPKKNNKFTYLLTYLLT